MHCDRHLHPDKINQNYCELDTHDLKLLANLLFDVVYTRQVGVGEGQVGSRLVEILAVGWDWKKG